MKYVTVETQKGFEVWPDEVGSELTAIFTERQDADLFTSCATVSGLTEDLIRNAAFNIASAFPDLNYSKAPINPDSELVLKIARIISTDLCPRHLRSAAVAVERCAYCNKEYCDFCDIACCNCGTAKPATPPVTEDSQITPKGEDLDHEG